MTNIFPISDRKHIPGLRVKLRTYLRSIGITQKLKIDIHRNGIIYIKSSEPIDLNIDTFEGYQVMTNYQIKIRIPSILEDCPKYWQNFIYHVRHLYDPADWHDRTIVSDRINLELQKYHARKNNQELTFNDYRHKLLFELKYS